MEEEQDEIKLILSLRTNHKNDTVEHSIIKDLLCIRTSMCDGYFDLGLKKAPIQIGITGTKYVFASGIDAFDRLMKKLTMLSVSANSILEDIQSTTNTETVYDNPPRCNYLRIVRWSSEVSPRYVIYTYHPETDKYTITTMRKAWEEYAIFDIWSQDEMSDMPQVPNKRYAISDDTANRLHDIAKQMYEISHETFNDLYYSKEPVVEDTLSNE